MKTQKTLLDSKFYFNTCRKSDRLPDKDTVIDLLQLNTPKYFSPTEEQDLIHYLDNEIDSYFVVEYGTIIIGCGGFNFSENKTIGKISWDIFHPDFQNKGFGSLLLKHRLMKLKEFENIRTISVRTSQFAYKFYEKYDFKLIEKIENYWAHGFDLYSMEYLKQYNPEANT